MRIYPLPDVVIAADAYDEYIRTYQQCKVVNPVSAGVLRISTQYIYIYTQGYIKVIYTIINQNIDI